MVELEKGCCRSGKGILIKSRYRSDSYLSKMCNMSCFKAIALNAYAVNI